MAEDGSPIGVWSYAARVHRYAWRWAWRHWKTMLLTAGVLGLATALSLVPYAMALGPGASLNEIAPSVILPFVSGLASMPVLYVIGLVWAPVEIHREQIIWEVKPATFVENLNGWMQFLSGNTEKHKILRR
ncbi:MAG: hypothetical protein IIB55_05045 [Planctomycetes bacterium]|nr:hypothetical protein [Planctomycetota bacterium]